MLQIVVPISPEGWDEKKHEFIEPKVQVLQLEHSLVSMSKWESKWCKPFLSTEDKTSEETLDYIKFMTLTPNVDSDVYTHLTRANMEEISDYIEAPMTATTFSEDKKTKGKRQIITAELIYYWMIALNIQFECQDWHLNKLITLIKVCNIKNSPPKKMSAKETNRQYEDLNAARRKKFKSKG